jgi:hypothetical protein
MSYLDGLKCSSELDKFSEGIKIQQKLLESRREKRDITKITEEYSLLFSKKQEAGINLS